MNQDFGDAAQNYEDMAYSRMTVVIDAQQRRITELEAEVKRLRWYERGWNQRDYLPDEEEAHDD